MKGTRVARAREALRSAIDKACVARGELQWINGYRCAYQNSATFKPSEDGRLYEKERELLDQCADAEGAAERAIRAYGAAVKAAQGVK